MNNNDIVQIAKKVTTYELDAVSALRDALEGYLADEFCKVVNLIKSSKGTLIITGMGKSGHVGKKMAATFASTGTKAFFVHPAEALHGDLGMISKEDVVLAISNSGNSNELNGIINYCYRFNIPLIAITAKKDSVLGNAATHVLLLPDVKEACSLGLAPTSSTTNTLVLGDVIAITLLELKGFSENDFRIFHPGGSIGSKLITISEVMHKDVPKILLGSTMQEALLVITSHSFGCVSVVDDQGDMVGIITDGDIRRHMNSNFLEQKVEYIMNSNFVIINKEYNSSKALLLMQEKNISNLFIIENKKPIGIIHMHDLINLGTV